MLDFAEHKRLTVASGTDRLKKSALGQFMTPSSVAKFMAGLFHIQPGEHVRLLDAGAGLGALTCAFLDRLKASNHAAADLFEIDEDIAAHLNEVLAPYSHRGIEVSICNEDYIEAATNMAVGHKRPYTHAILNPPYKKIAAASWHRMELRRAGLETVNLYSGFVGLAILALGRGGQMVVIMPRSFANGPYYLPFRNLLLDNCAIRRMHLFDARDKAFKDDAVLQETIIMHLERDGIQGEVQVSRSTDDSFSDIDVFTVTFDEIVRKGDKERFIHVPSDGKRSPLEQVLSERASLEELGLKVSTGPVVDFRMRQYLHAMPSTGTVPLLYPVHFRNLRLEWPVEGKKSNAITLDDDTAKWMYPSGWYAVCRRFTAKEERRRVVAGVIDPNELGNAPAIGIENHVNLYHSGKRGTSEQLAKGLATYLNTTAVDEHFRRFNGHTQVNASDLKSLPYPRLSALEKLGAWAIHTNDYSQEAIDEAFRKGRMSVDKKLREALIILETSGLPRAQINERSALTLLALLNLQPKQSWKDAEEPLIGITPVMDWMRTNYGKEYAPNTRETIRRQTMHQFVEAGIAMYNPDDPKRAVNSPKAVYQIEPHFLAAVRTYGTKAWSREIADFLSRQQSLVQRYAKERQQNRIPVKFTGGRTLSLSAGDHSELIRDIIEDFGARFAPGGLLVYAGDTGDKWGYFDEQLLAKLGVDPGSHGKMPDVIILDTKRNWLLLIEAVTSHGPVDGKRHDELTRLFSSSTAGLVYVTAFPNRAIMARYLPDIAWETEVWVADAPSHLIHFNGDRYLGPHA